MNDETKPVDDVAPAVDAMELADDAVGPVTLPGRIRAGARVLALNGMVLGIGAIGMLGAPPSVTISAPGVGA